MNCGGPELSSLSTQKWEDIISLAPKLPTSLSPVYNIAAPTREQFHKSHTTFVYPSLPSVPSYDVVAKYASCTRSRRNKVGQTETAPAIKLPLLFTLPAIHLSPGVNACQTETHEFFSPNLSPKRQRRDVTWPCGATSVAQKLHFLPFDQTVTFRWQDTVRIMLT